MKKINIILVLSALFLFAAPVFGTGVSGKYYNSGMDKIAAGDYGAAIRDFDMAVKLDNRNAAAFCMRGVAYDWLADKQGNTDCSAAVKDFNTAIKLRPGMQEPYFYRGVRLAKLHAYKDALADFNKAIELDPTDAGAYYNRYLVYDSLRKYKEARADYDKAVKLGFKQEDLFGASGHDIMKVYLICVGIFVAIIALIIGIALFRANRRGRM